MEAQGCSAPSVSSSCHGRCIGLAGQDHASQFRLWFSKVLAQVDEGHRSLHRRESRNETPCLRYRPARASLPLEMLAIYCVTTPACAYTSCFCMQRTNSKFQQHRSKDLCRWNSGNRVLHAEASCVSACQGTQRAAHWDNALAGPSRGPPWRLQRYTVPRPAHVVAL